MKIWVLATDCNKDMTIKEEVSIVGADYFQHNFNRKPLGEGWISPPINIINKNRRVRDFVSFSLSVPVISVKAKFALASAIEKQCEIVPLLELKGVQYYAINVLNVIDCFDIENADVTWAPDLPKRVSRIRSHAFHLDRIPEDTTIFKIPGRATSLVYVTQQFIDIVIDNNLRGADFWDPAQDNLIQAALGKPLNVVPGLPE